MDSKELVRAGKLSEARDQLTREVKSAPTDLGKRTLLFQVLSFCGEWNKAEKHLEAVAVQDSSRETGVQVYRNIVKSEKERREILRLNRRPSFLPETPGYAELFFEALKDLTEKKIKEAGELFASVEGRMPVLSGTVDGQGFAGFRDTDAFSSFFLETVVHDRCVWFPFESLRELSISAPRTLFDLLWIPARILTWGGLSVYGYLFVHYSDSSSHEDERVKLGRMTDWHPWGGGFFKGMGQRVFRIGEIEKPILEIREVAFHPPAAGKDHEQSH